MITSTDAKARAAQERSDLLQRIDKLHRFIHCYSEYDNLSRAQRTLLRKQLRVMNRYQRILLKRLTIWDN
uniref:Uncharacterized protein n=1 Tax=Podoviridae sp. ctsUe5 TaxID=2827750 RepID=A0A8S5S6E5_9CAUD|nr:MAG TPA: hypothetical protein [Podoviridae sp. ctsUe5]